MNRKTLAAIDIGSNAIRLLINYIEEGDNLSFRKAAFIRVPIRLGEDVFTKGEIGEDKQERLTKAMISFSHLMSTFNVMKYRACATSAMREARNGAQVVEQIKQASGISIEIISGKDEAKTIFEAGGISGMMSSNKSYIYVDVGGGSTEVTLYCNAKRICSESFELGTVRAISEGLNKTTMQSFKEWLKTVALPHNPIAIIGSGGNINKIHKLLGKKEHEPLYYVETRLLYNQLEDMTYDERIEKMGLNSYRADVIVPALKIFLTVSKCCRINEIAVPKVGLADGVIHQLYREHFK